ncbi:MAG TPA: drug/metabolite exporter YedA [Candidatus Limnocylindria bacterium]|nr:drug/metabolite exporter YedA [Candidatus Limnocylindria bacterium]
MSIQQEPTVTPSRWAFVLAFTSIYLIWGSTYLAIRIAVEAWPPFLMAGLRFLVAGAVLFAWLRLRGAAWPALVHWRNSAVTGVLLLVGGNGLVTWAEKSVSSSTAALIVGTVPAWFALFEWMRPSGKRPAILTVIGITIGFTGVVLLVENSARHAQAGSFSYTGIAALFFSTVCWAGGSVFSKYSVRPASPYMASAMQMLVGGVALLGLSGLTGEARGFSFSQLSFPGWASFSYLVVAGSWIGFSAYAWLIRHASPAKVSTYAFVNPVVAVLLGTVFLGEKFTPSVLLSVVAVVTGVALITLSGSIRWPRLRASASGAAAAVGQKCS